MAAKEAPPAVQMPNECDGDAEKVCTPPPAFVDALCEGGVYLDAALVLFEKESPFSRGYLTGDVDGWYASGRASTRAKLSFDEEVLVLRFRPPAKTGIVINGAAGSYDVLRWDGTCYTLDARELTMRRPPKAKRPSIPFRYLGPRMQDALLADTKVKAAYDRRSRECRGVTHGDVSMSCKKADDGLTNAVIDHVRGAGSLPAPDKIPGS